MTFWVTQGKMPPQESPSQVSKPSFLENSPSSPPAAVCARSSPPPLPKVICTIPSSEGQGWLERGSGAEDSRQAPRRPWTVPVAAQGCVSPGSQSWPFPCPGPQPWSSVLGGGGAGCDGLLHPYGITDLRRPSSGLRISCRVRGGESISKPGWDVLGGHSPFGCWGAVLCWASPRERCKTLLGSFWVSSLPETEEKAAIQNNNN